MDPLSPKYPELSPYQFASLNPIWLKEIEGLEGTASNKAEAKAVLDEALKNEASHSAEVVVAFEKGEDVDKIKTKPTKVQH